MAVNTDNITQFLEGIRDERRTHANTAQRIGTALLMLLALVEKQLDLSVFLRNDIDNDAKAVIGFDKGLKLGDGGVWHRRLRRGCAATYRVAGLRRGDTAGIWYRRPWRRQV